MIKKYWFLLRQYIVIGIYHPCKWLLSCMIFITLMITYVFASIAEFLSDLDQKILGVLMLIFTPHFARHAYKQGYEAGLAGKRKPYTYQWECDKWAFAIGHKRGCKDAKGYE